MTTTGKVRGIAGSETQRLAAPMDRRGFLCAGVAAALALPVLGVAAKAEAAGVQNQAVDVVILTSADPEVGIGGWIDTADGGRYAVADGVVAIPGAVGQSLGATVYRDDGCTQEITLVFQPATTFVEVGGC